MPANRLSVQVYDWDTTLVGTRNRRAERMFTEFNRPLWTVGDTCTRPCITVRQFPDDFGDAAQHVSASVGTGIRQRASGRRRGEFLATAASRAAKSASADENFGSAVSPMRLAKILSFK